MLNVETATLFPLNQASRRQFLSVDVRLALIGKADDLKRAGLLKAVDVDVLRYFFHKCPGTFTGEWRPSHASIAAHCGASSDTIERSLARLKRCGLIDWKRRRSRVLEAAAGAAGRVRHFLRSLPNAYSFPEAAIKLASDALIRLAKAQPFFRFDYFAARRSKQRAARAAVSLCAPSPAAPRDPGPPRPLSIGRGLLSFLEGMAR